MRPFHPVLGVLALVLVAPLVPGQVGPVDLAGTWTGPAETTHFNATMRLVLRSDSTGVMTGEVSLSPDGATAPASLIRGLARNGDTVTFAADISGLEVRFSATLKDATLAGSLDAYSNGEPVGGGTFTLTRQ